MSISADIPLVLVLQSENNRPPGPNKRFFGLNILIPYYTKYLSFIKKINSRYGDIVFFEAGGEKIFLVNDPGFIEHILVSNTDNYLRGTGFARLRMLLGEGMLSTDGPVQKKHRTMIQPSFHKRSVDDYTRLISNITDNEINKWGNYSQVEIQENSVDLFLQIICTLLFNDEEHNNRKNELIENVKFFDSLTYNYKSFVLLGMPELSKKLPLKWIKRYYKSVSRLDELIYAMVNDRKNNHTSGTDILSLLISAKDENREGLSDKEIRDELVTILFAAYDTSARTLTWSLYLLSKYPDELKKLSSFDSDVELSAYLDMVISEALRIYPPGHSITRVSDKDDSYGQYSIPAGSSIIISPYLLHRDSKHYHHPMQFIPGRWSPENKKNINRFTYLPFGAGKRSCMGEVFARMQVNVALKKICTTFDFSIQGKAKESASLTLKPAGKIMLNLKQKHNG